MANTPQEQTPFYVHFTHYNRYISDLSFYEIWLANKKYRDLSHNARTLLFNDYLTKLIAKTQIDILLNRKEEIIKNQANLTKLQKVMNTYNVDNQLIQKAGFDSFQDLLSSPLKPLNGNTQATVNTSNSALTNDIKKGISYVNGIRLSIMGYRNLINFYFKTNNIQRVSQVVSAFNDFASYTFYFARGSLEAGKLLKHTFLTDHEILRNNKISWEEKLSLQLGLRYGILINDSLWGVINFLTSQVLTGAGSLGYAGNVLTIMLLFSDFLVSLFNIYLARKKYDEFITQLTNDLNKNKILDEEKNKILAEFKAQHNKNIRDLQWSAIFAGTFCFGFVVFLNFLIPGPHYTVLMPLHLIWVGSIIIVALQLVDVIRKTYLKLKEAGDSKDLKQIAFLEGIANILTQITIPGLMLATGFLISATPALPAWFFIACMMLTSGAIIQTISVLKDYFVISKEIDHLKKLQHKLSSSSEPNDQEDCRDVQGKITEKEQARTSAMFNIKNNLINSGIAASAMTILGIVLVGTSTIMPFILIPIAIASVLAILKEIIDAPKPGNAPPEPALSPT